MQALAAFFIFALLFGVALSANLGAICVNAQINLVNQMDTVCEIDSPYCVYNKIIDKVCASCRVIVSLPSYGGSCECDARTTYCSQSDNSGGFCLLYSMLNNPCTNDAQCQSTVVRDLPSGGTVILTEERLFCVNNKCKPCSPTLWNSTVGAGASLTCAGYSASISSAINRYATATRLSGIEYTCSNDGEIVYLQDVVDYNYQYPCGDRANWPSGCTPSPSVGPNSSPSSTPSSAAGLFVVSFALLFVPSMVALNLL